MNSFFKTFMYFAVVIMNNRYYNVNISLFSCCKILVIPPYSFRPNNTTLLTEFKNIPLPLIFTKIQISVITLK